MKKSLLTSVLFLSCGVLLGCGGMYLVHISTTGNNTTAGTEEGRESNSNRSTQERDTQLTGELNERIFTNNDSVASIDDPNLHTDSFQRRLAIYTHVAGLTVQEMTTELEAISNGSQKYSYHVRDELQSALVERLAIVKPETAVKFAVEQAIAEPDRSPQGYSPQYLISEGEPLNMPGVQSVFSDWAMNDLSSAIRGANSLSTDAKSNALTGILNSQVGSSLETHRQIARELGDEQRGVDSYVQSFASRQVDDPRAAWNEVIAYLEPNNYRHSRALMNVASQWYEQDGFNVLDEISQSNLDSNFKSNFIRQLLWQAAETHPEKAFQFALKMPSEGRFPHTLNTVVNTWSESDPQAAFQAVNEVEQTSVRDQLQRNVVRNWSRNEPRYVLDHIDIFPTHLQVSVKRDAITSIARKSPKEAAELALQIEGMGGEIVGPQIMRWWVEQDAEAAINWVYNGPVSKESQYSWVSALTSSLVASDPRRAFDLAMKQEIPQETSLMGFGTYQPPGLEADVISRIASQDLDLAEELLPRVRDGITKNSAYSAVGDRYIDEGHSNKAVELGLKLSDEDQVTYFQGIALTWARVDPVGLVASIKELPTEAVRSGVASVLSNRWYRDNFTEEQIDTLKQYLSDSDRQALEDQ